MASEPRSADHELEEIARESGIPPKGRIGASRGELFALALGAAAFLLIAVAFWWQSNQ
jgi:hypothetical protein